MSQEKPKRRWYQFSLRTMLVIMIVVSASFGYWVNWSREWIRQRHEWLRAHDAGPGAHTVGRNGGMLMPYNTTAPATLWLFGENGLGSAVVDTDEEIEEVKRLFPEAAAVLYDYRRLEK